ncbi:imidazolonepropionase [Myxococcota bacterium]|nr:imidazolonepropionase [Myxococcota bacterium]
MVIIECTVTSDQRAAKFLLDGGEERRLGAWEMRTDVPWHAFPSIESVQLAKNGRTVRVVFHDGVEAMVDASRFFSPTTPELFIHNIGQLLTMGQNSGVGLSENTALLAGQGRIIALGDTDDLAAQIGSAHGVSVINAHGKTVSPGLVDAHTHPVFSGNRAHEFSLRLSGSPYDEILAAGGGIHNSASKTRACDTETLLAEASQRIRRSLAFGVTAMEAKSGYALTFDGEIKSLEVIELLNLLSPVTFSPSLLAAHVVPREFMENRQGYVSLITESLLPVVAQRNLAIACDVFCETSAFSLEETTIILERARELGLATRIHAGQFNSLGAVSLGARLGALSVDHLEAVSEQEFQDLACSQTVATLLPGAALTLGMTPPSARPFLDRGIPVALATDMNPGTSMTENLPLMASLGTMQMGMTIDEAWRGITVNGARAAGLPRKGSLQPGFDADFVICDFEDYAVLPYHFGSNHVARVFVGGREISI